MARDLELWEAQGYNLVGIPSYKFGDRLDDSVTAIQRAGVGVSNVVIVSPFTLGQPENWDAQRSRALALVEVASRLDAGCVYMNSGSSRSRMTVDESIAAFCQAVEPVVAHAAELGVRLAVEPSAQTNHDMGCIHSLSDAFYVADETGLDVVIDVQTCWLERGLGATLARRMDQVALVQISDYVVGTEVRMSRAVPGDGDIPLERLIADILDGGYGGIFDLEVLGPRIEEEGYESAVARGVSWLSDCLASLGA